MRKQVGMLLVTTLLASTLTACGSSSGSTTTTAAATQAAGSSATEAAKTEETSSEASTGRDSIVIAVASDVLSMDPYRYNETPTNQFMLHIYEGLVERDANGDIVPALAETWEMSEDGVTWTFNLRKDVKFHDGSDFTAEDVLASFAVAGDANSPSAYSSFCAPIAEITAVDDYTVQMVTDGVYPLLLADIVNIYCLKKENIEGKTEEEIASTVIGTGRYTFVEQVAEDHIDITVNENYWGEIPAIKNVRFRPISNDSTRTATMLSNEIDLCIDIPVRDVERLENTDGIQIITQPGLREIYINLDTREDSPAYEGVNPMADAKVREAMYLAIDTETIIKNVMNGMASEMVSYLHPSALGYKDTAARSDYDPERAKELLAEAGYPDGFTVTFDASNDRYVNDGDIAQAVTGYWEKIGIDVNLNLMPKANFFTYISVKYEDTHLLMTGWSDSTGEGITWIRDLLHTYDADSIYGGVNRGYYSNPEVDALIEAAMVETDADKRAELTFQADEIARSEFAYIPLHYELDIFAASDDINYTPRASKYVQAWDITFK